MTNRRVALGGVLLALVAIAPAGAAPDPAPQGGRVQTQQYSYSHGVDTWHWKVEADLPPLVFTPRPGDRWMHLAVEDAAGQPVFLHIRQEADGAGKDMTEHFCDRADILRLVSDEPVEVYVFSGACRNHTTGFATTGTLTATFARRL